MSVKPLHDRVLIKRVEEENKTAGGIIIPGSSAEKPSIGEVIAVGEGSRNFDGSLNNLTVKVGDKVLFERAMHAEVKVESENLLIMRETSILAVFN